MTGNQCKGGGINLQEIFGANKNGERTAARSASVAFKEFLTGVAVWGREAGKFG